MLTDPPRADSIDAEVLLGVCAGAIPIAGMLVVDPAGWFPFTVAKWWAVVVVVIAAVACRVAIVVPRRSTSLTTAADGSIVALAAIVVASAVVAVDGVYAWVGTPVRHLGAMTWVLFALAYVVGRGVGTLERARLIVWWAFVLAGVGLAVYGAVEALFGAPVRFVTSSDRVGGPFGSASYLGAALCLVVPLAGGAVLVARSRLGRVAASVLVVALLALVALSGSRAALLGLAVAGGTVLLLLPGVRRRGTALVVASTTVVAVVVGGFWRGAWERRSGWGSRLDEWQLAWRTIGERPLLGAGPEGYRLVVGQSIDADYVRRYGEAVAIDRAHSGVLDVAVASGTAAALAYLAVLGAVVWACVVVVRRGGAPDVSLAAAALAYAVQQQLLFPIAELDPAFWLLVGIVVTRATASFASFPSAPVGRWRLVASVGVGLVAVGALVIGLSATAADRLAKSSLDAASLDDATSRAQRATELAPLDVRHRLLLADALERDRSLGGIDRALDAVADATEISPLDLGVRYERADLLRIRAAITGEESDRDSAKRAWDDLLADWPNCARCHLGAARAALERGDATANGHLDTAIDLGSEDAAALASQIGEE